MENTNQTGGMSKEALMQHAHGFEAKLEPFFAKFPHIPEGGRKVIADIVPWLALIFGILGLLGLFTAGALMALFAIPALLTGGIWVITGFITTVIGLITVILQLMAFTPLKARMKKGWNYIFYGVLLGALSTIITVVGGVLSMSTVNATSSLIGGIVGFLIGGWLLFEIKNQYK